MESSWIMSAGGPLLCVQDDLQRFWGGTSQITVPTPGLRNDYDRIVDTKNYAEKIRLHVGSALLLGGGPLDTCFWLSADQSLYIVRVEHCESDFDLAAKMGMLDDKIFDFPAEETTFNFASSGIVIFDSADAGFETDKEVIYANIAAGTYCILTQVFEPDQDTALVLHKFKLKPQGVQ